MKSFIIEPTNAMFIQEKIDTRPFNDKFHGEKFATSEPEVVSSFPSKHKMAQDIWALSVWSAAVNAVK